MKAGRISEKLSRLSEAATPMNLASAEIYDEAEEIECPLCQTNGYVEANSYVNIDGVALNVQFSGIGGEFGANEEFFLALLSAYRSGELIPVDRVNALIAAAREEGRRESDERFREIERLYYAEGKDLSWRAAHMRAIAEEHFALRDKKEPGQ